MEEKQPGNMGIFPGNHGPPHKLGAKNAAQTGRHWGNLLLDFNLGYGDMGVAVLLGDVGGIVVGDGDGITYGDGISAFQRGVGHMDGVAGDILTTLVHPGAVVVAVALADLDADGAAVDEGYGAGDGGFVQIQLGQGGGIVAFQNIAAAEHGDQHHCGQYQTEFTHGISPHSKYLLYSIPECGKKQEKSSTGGICSEKFDYGL